MILPSPPWRSGVPQTRIRALAALLLVAWVGLLAGCSWSGGSGASQAPQLTAIAVGPPDSSLPIGMSAHFTATGLYSDGSKHDISTGVVWQSTDSSVATVANGGAAMALKPGSTTITASAGTVFGATALAVSPRC